MPTFDCKGREAGCRLWQRNGNVNRVATVDVDFKNRHVRHSGSTYCYTPFFESPVDDPLATWILSRDSDFSYEIQPRLSAGASFAVLP